MSKTQFQQGRNGRQKKVCLLSDHHLCINPRLWKEAFFYEKAGYRVVILTMWQNEELLRKDLDILLQHNIEYRSFLNLVPRDCQPLVRFFYRARKRVAMELQKRFNISSGWAISHAPELLLKKALEENADLYCAHLECAFFVGRSLVKKGKKVSFDFEDWYSRDYLVPERPVKLLAALEKFALAHGIFCTAPSIAMSRALATTYKAKEPTVIYNGFPVNETLSTATPNKQPRSRVKLIWFSRTIGPDRGIEVLLKLLAKCFIPVELNLLGKMAEGYRSFLERNFPYVNNHQLIVHPFIAHKELMTFLPGFDIGLATEVDINHNRSLTITNKIIQYLQAGLYVIASDTEGQREVAALFPEWVNIVNLQSDTAFNNAISNFKQQHFKTDRQKFENEFSWEAQEKKLSKLTGENLWV